MTKYTLELLLVEDEEGIRNSLKELIHHLFKNITIIEATNGFEALEILKNKHIDILVTDIDMPLMDGYSLISKVNEINKKIYIAIVSAHPDQEIIEKLKVDIVIKKPSIIRPLLEFILSIIEQQTK